MVKNFKKVLFGGYKKSQVLEFAEETLDKIEKQQKMYGEIKEELEQKVLELEKKAVENERLTAKNQGLKSENEQLTAKNQELISENKIICKEYETLKDNCRKKIAALGSLNSEKSLKLEEVKQENDELKKAYDYIVENIGNIIVAAEGVADEIIDNAKESVKPIDSAISDVKPTANVKVGVKPIGGIKVNAKLKSHPAQKVAEIKEELASEKQQSNVVDISSVKNGRTFEFEKIEQELINMQNDMNRKVDEMFKTVISKGAGINMKEKAN